MPPRSAGRLVDSGFPCAPHHIAVARGEPGRRYDDEVVEIVVDLADGLVVSVWVTQVNR